MLAQAYLEKGCIVPKHSHENEQLTYIVDGCELDDAGAAQGGGRRRSLRATEASALLLERPR
jgi:hypothetical protein